MGRAYFELIRTKFESKTDSFPISFYVACFIIYPFVRHAGINLSSHLYCGIDSIEHEERFY